MTGAFATFERPKHADMIRLLQASVTFAGVTPPQEIFGTQYITGSSIYENDVVAAIAHCEKLGYAHSDIIIDTIIGTNILVDYFDTKKSNSVQMLVRSAVLIEFYEKANGILRAKQSHNDVMFRYIIGPTEKMAHKISPMEFSLERTKQLFQDGEH
jgi:hypothetical protein